MTAEAYQKVMSALSVDPDTDGRRSARRQPMNARVPVLPMQANDLLGDAFPTTLCDLSRTGLALLSRRRLEVGTAFMVYLPSGVRRPLTFRCRVCRCDGPHRTRNLYRIAASFEAKA